MSCWRCQDIPQEVENCDIVIIIVFGGGRLLLLISSQTHQSQSVVIGTLIVGVNSGYGNTEGFTFAPRQVFQGSSSIVARERTSNQTLRALNN